MTSIFNFSAHRMQGPARDLFCSSLVPVVDVVPALGEAENRITTSLTDIRAPRTNKPQTKSSAGSFDRGVKEGQKYCQMTVKVQLTKWPRGTVPFTVKSQLIFSPGKGNVCLILGFHEKLVSPLSWFDSLLKCEPLRKQKWKKNVN